MMAPLELAISKWLMTPPNEKVHHIDRIPWDQCDLIAVELVKYLCHLYDEDMKKALNNIKL